MTLDNLAVVYVDDDETVTRQTAQYLEGHGVAVTVAHEARIGFGAILRSRPDVVILGCDATSLCRELRARLDTPIVVVTARADEDEWIAVLESGADDCLAKPLSPRELLARIRAHARRARGALGPPKDLRAGRITIDRGAMRAMLDDEPLALTTYEFMLLASLAERAGNVVTREQVVDIARGSAEEAFERSVDIHVSHLRAKLGDDPRRPRLIKTVRGLGYMLAIDEAR